MLIRKLFFVILALFILQPHAVYAFAITKVAPAAGTTENGKHLSQKDQMMIAELKVFANMSMKEYEQLTGQKSNFFQRLSFRMNQHRARVMLKAYDYGDGPTTLQKISWLLKGILLGPIAVALAYIFLKDDDRELIKWAWFGFIGFTAIVVILLLSM